MRLLGCAALVALAWLAMAPQHAAAQPCPTDKYCFYVPPGLPFEGSHSMTASRSFDIVLSSPVDTVTGTYSISGAAPQPFTVSPGTSRSIALGTGGAAPSYGTPSNVGVFLVSDAPAITVDHRETFDQEQYSETIKRDTIALGSRFRLGSYSLNLTGGRVATGVDAVMIYAPTGATVTLTAPAAATLPYWEGSATTTRTATLAAGETIALRTVVGRDMDGALLTSTAPVSVSAGGRGWAQNGCGDDGMDGLVPTSSLGREFVVQLPTNSDQTNNESRVRVIADVDGTEVRINGALAATLSAGTFHNFTPTALSYIQTTQPVVVWMNGSLDGCELDTVLIPPIAFAPALTQLSLDFNVIARAQANSAQMALLIPTAEVSSIRLDGAALAAPTVTAVPGRPELSYVRFFLTSGDRNVRATSDFQALLASRTSPSGLLAYYNPYRIPGCGDSGVDPGEQCDDGNASDGDGCNATCQVEPGYSCSGVPSVCVSTCGNNTVDAGETCDDGNRTAGDGCNATCRREVAISTPANGATVTSTTPTLTGTADPGASVMITLDGASGTVTADGMGAWSFTPTTPLSDGAKTAMVAATDSASGVSMTTRSFTVDSGTTVAIVGPTGTIMSATPAITGTGEPGAMIAVSVDGMNVGSATVGSDGSWMLPLTTPLSSGPHTTGAIATDAAGNSATATGVTFTVDASTSVSITQPRGNAQTDRMPTIGGNGEVGIVVVITIDGTNVGTATVGSDGTWMLPLTTPLSEGPHTVTAVGTDPQGNTATSSVDFSVREVVLLIHNVPDGAFTRDPRPPFNGVASPGAQVLISLDGVLLDTVVSSYRGAWELRLIDVLTPGIHVLDASTTGKSGRTISDRHTFTYEPDTTPLTLTTPVPGSVTADSTPTITGTSSPGTRVRISIDGRQLGEATSGGDGTFSFDVPTPLTDGRHVVRLDANDSARNPAAVEGPFFVDTQTRVQIRVPADGARVGSARPFFGGTAEPLSRLTIAIDGVDVGELDVPIDGVWVFQPTNPISGGDHRVRARVIDQLGNRAEDEHGFRYDPAQTDDRDGDGRPDSEECRSTPCPDSDGDGIADVDDPDDDGDGIPTAQECSSTPCPDSDGDGTPDYLDPDDDGDGRPTRDELTSGKPRDTDSDGVPDHLDPDDDGDSIPTRTECMAAPCPDTDGDGISDYLDPDDDNDRVPTAREKADSDRLGKDDHDGDGRKNWQDPDANDNGADDGTDGVGDADNDGTPDYLDTDTMRPTPPNTQSAVDYSVAGGGGCAVGARVDTSWLWALALLLLRRRSLKW
ncbi:MAG: Ig-like domain-containing protein [Polyangiales bacterium]